MGRLLFLLSVLVQLGFSINAHAQYVVSLLDDVGDDDINDGIYYPATLRSALENANMKGVAATITISPTISTGTILLTQDLPCANISLKFEGNGVTLKPAAGSNAGTGLCIRKDYSEIRNVQVQDFNGSGIVWQGSYGIIELVSSHHNKGPGLNLNYAHGNIIGNTRKGYFSNTFYGNSGTGGTGITLIESDENIIQYCFLGLNTLGNIDANSRYGVWIDKSYGTVIRENTISGNEYGGIFIDGRGSESYTSIKENFIGTNQFGQLALPNNTYGISVSNSRYDTIINNVISGNDGVGIFASGGSYGTIIKENKIGTDISAKNALPNSGGITCGGFEYVITDNIISGNTGTGLSLNGYDCEVKNNIIGLDSTQTKAIPNGQGMSLTNRSDYLLFIGDTLDPFSNVIAGNLGDGIHVIGAGVKNILIGGNMIGANKDTVPFPNGKNGILMTHSVDGIDVYWNIISSNGENGIKIIRNVVIFTDPTIPSFLQRPRDIFITQNCIGCANTQDVGGRHGGAGIYVLNGDSIYIHANNIWGTDGDGIFIDDSVHYVGISHNDIGGFSETDDKRNIGGDGIHVSYASDVLIGSQVNPADSNIIQFCKGHGISVTDSASIVNIFWNAFYRNEKGGIQLDHLEDYWTTGASKDRLDADSGSNGLQNVVATSKARAQGNTVEIRGYLHGKPNTTYRIEPFLAEDLPDSIQYRVQGVFPLQWFTMKTDSTGLALLDTSWSSAEIAAYSADFPFVTLTASGPEGTSQFSRIVPDTASAYIDIDTVIDTALSKVDSNGVVTLVAHIVNNGTGNATVITLKDSVSSKFFSNTVSVTKGTANFFDSTFTAVIPSLQPGEEVTYTAVGNPNVIGLHKRSVVAIPSQDDLYPANNRDTISFQVTKVTSLRRNLFKHDIKVYQLQDQTIRVAGLPEGNLTLRTINLLGQVQSVVNLNGPAREYVDIEAPAGLSIVEVYRGNELICWQKVWVADR